MMVDATAPQTNRILAETVPLAKLTMPFGLAPMVPRHCINAMGCYTRCQQKTSVA